MNFIFKTKLKTFFIFNFAIFASMVTIAQTFEQALEAYGKKDYATALIGFKKLAAQGDAKGQLGLGSIYESGEGVQK